MGRSVTGWGTIVEGFGTGLGNHGEVQERSWDPRGGLRWVEEISLRSGTGRETHGEVRDES